MSFLEFLSENIRRFPNKPAIEFLGQPEPVTTYAELGDLVGRSAAYLAGLGIRKGDRVALQLPKCLEFILLNLGTLSLGAISLPLNPAYPRAELAYFLRDSGARAFFGKLPDLEVADVTAGSLPHLNHVISVEAGRSRGLVSRLRGVAPLETPAVTPRPDDTAVLVYTSGTTGRPKGAEITHGNLTAMLGALHTAWEWQADDVLLHVLPLFHIHGLLVALYGALRAGASTVLMESFDAEETLRLLEDRRYSVLMGVPTIHRRLVEARVSKPVDLGHMRLITSGSDRLPDRVFEAFQKTFGYTLVERYGMTETGINCSNPVHGDRRMGSVGLPLPSVEVRIAGQEDGQPADDGAVGEVQVRGPSVFKGYWQQPEHTAASFTEDGWFRTGDMGMREPDGYFRLNGRARDLIISGGLNVYPPEVERVLQEHPAVESNAVIGCADEEWGERVVALVVLRRGFTASEQELITFCRERLASYKAPKRVLLRSELPRNAMGKVQKSILRDEVCGGR